MRTIGCTLLGALFVGGCTADLEAIELRPALVAADESCVKSIVEQLDRVMIEIAGPTNYRGPCTEISNPPDLEAVRNKLIGAQLPSAEEGTYRLRVFGFDEHGCTAKDVVRLCGEATLKLPPPSEALEVRVRCSGDPSSASFEQCAAL